MGVWGPGSGGSPSSQWTTGWPVPGGAEAGLGYILFAPPWTPPGWGLPSILLTAEVGLGKGSHFSAAALGILTAPGICSVWLGLFVTQLDRVGVSPGGHWFQAVPQVSAEWQQWVGLGEKLVISTTLREQIFWGCSVFSFSLCHEFKMRHSQPVPWILPLACALFLLGHFFFF